MTNLTCDQKLLRETACDLSWNILQPRAAEIDRTEEYPWNNVEDLTEAGFMGMTIPAKYGGRGLNYFDAILVIEEIAKVCGVSARIVVEANMGGVGAIMKYGSEDQKKLASKLILEGDKPAICITEPGAGSAATDMSTTAVKHGSHYVLNGTKHWITGGGVSKLHLIFAKVVEDGESKGVAGFLAVRGMADGLKTGNREPAMGLRGIPETEVILDNLVVSEDMMVVPPEGVKRGFAGLMNAYNGQRVGAGTVALGIAQGAFELALDHARKRHQFGRPIAEFQGLQWMLADMSIGLTAARALLHNTAKDAGTGFPDMAAAAQAKILASETAIKVTNDALQIHGASGYSRNLPLERMARDARMFTIGGGTAQVLRTQVASSILDMKLPQTRDGYVDSSAEKPKVSNKPPAPLLRLA
ncbi:MAG: acyl-CoA dehydrogenase family protein [Roseibium sp.]|uniref:3-sulfinopropanoyl-CoA desulfinase n=1 Tax=Roseibium sp. TaxID=1936156 RepID=UPI002625B1CE|nr:3-sulfinopropanoyl-CoA desulfinase [Roseibium sp.]MCV0429883.1 acyl-CoA dehydrogenase family protein [Roseibium sp.]